MRRFLAGLSCVAMVMATLCGFSEAQAAKASLQTIPDPGTAVQVRYEPQARQTRIAAQPASDVCASLALPQEWHSTSGGIETHLKSAVSDAALTVSLRSSHELRGLPQPDLASRDAALLQQDYESLLGRPAQSVSLLPVSAGTTRWSATWIDPHLPSGPMTVEAFIVPLSEDWVLELSLSDVDTKDEHDSLVRSLLTGLRVQHGQGCGGQMAF
jgi:hypothetical protein